MMSVDLRFNIPANSRSQFSQRVLSLVPSLHSLWEIWSDESGVSSCPALFFPWVLVSNSTRVGELSSLDELSPVSVWYVNHWGKGKKPWHSRALPCNYRGGSVSAVQRLCHAVQVPCTAVHGAWSSVRVPCTSMRCGYCGSSIVEE